MERRSGSRAGDAFFEGPGLGRAKYEQKSLLRLNFRCLAGDGAFFAPEFSTMHTGNMLFSSLIVH